MTACAEQTALSGKEVEDVEGPAAFSAASARQPGNLDAPHEPGIGDPARPTRGGPRPTRKEKGERTLPERSAPRRKILPVRKDAPSVSSRDLVGFAGLAAGQRLAPSSGQAVLRASAEDVGD